MATAPVLELVLPCDKVIFWAVRVALPVGVIVALEPSAVKLKVPVEPTLTVALVIDIGPPLLTVTDPDAPDNGVKVSILESALPLVLNSTPLLVTTVVPVTAGLSIRLIVLPVSVYPPLAVIVAAVPVPVVIKLIVPEVAVIELPRLMAPGVFT